MANGDATDYAEYKSLFIERNLLYTQFCEENQNLITYYNNWFSNLTQFDRGKIMRTIFTLRAQIAWKNIEYIFFHKNKPTIEYSENDWPVDENIEYDKEKDRIIILGNNINHFDAIWQ